MISFVSAGWFGITGNAVKKSELEWGRNYCTIDDKCPINMGDCDSNKGVKRVIDSNKNKWVESDECQTGWCQLNAGKQQDPKQRNSVDVCGCPEGTGMNILDGKCYGEFNKSDKQVKRDDKVEKKVENKAEKEAKKTEALVCKKRICRYRVGTSRVNAYLGERFDVNVTSTNKKNKSIIVSIDDQSITLSEGRESQSVPGTNLLLVHRGFWDTTRKYARIEIRNGLIDYPDLDGYLTGVEVDEMINEALDQVDTGIAITDVLTMLGNATSTGQITVSADGNVGADGNAACEPKSCIFGFGGIVVPDTEYFNQDETALVSCGTTYDLNEMSGHADWVEGSAFRVQYLCVDA